MAAPTNILVTGGIIREQAVSGVLVATLATDDPDLGDTFTYTLTDPSGAFTIVGNEIRVLDGSLIDFETAQSMSVTVEVMDSTGNTRSEAVTIQVLDVNEILGTDAGETIDGTIGDDLIDALAGNDTVDAGAGSDIVNAGDGNDTVVSGTGNDQIFGGAGFDQLAGGSGDDTLDAGADGAAMDGGTGADILTGSIVADQFTLVSDGSDDTATGGEGNDSFALLGNFTAGVFYQDQAGLNGGTDAVSGGDGNDTFDLSQSAERVLAFGGDGDDSFGSLAGTGELHGDGGSDSFNVHGGLSNFNNPLLVDGGADDDVIALNDRRGTLLTVLGGEGNDQITGIGSGSIDAGTGNDTLSAHVLGATITLGTGQDRLTLLSWDNTSSVTVTDFAAGPGGDTLDINAILTNNLTSWDGSSNPFGSGHLRLAQDGDDTLLQVDQNGAAGGESYITLVRFQNTNAADFITNSFLPPYPLDGSTPVGQHIVGTPGDDPNLQGTIGDDLIDALAGNDTVDAGAGSDIVNAGDGNDTVVSGTGNDQIFGGAGFDQLAGGSGDDTLDAGADGAAMDGGTGADILTGSIVADQFTLVSDGSDDTATGGEGNDSFALLGNFTAGVFYQDQAGLNGGTDAVSGGDGNDTFDLSQSAERVLAFGGDGDDSFGSLAGTGELHGDGGSDSFNVHGGLSNFNNPLLVDGGADDDVIALNDRRGTLLTVLGGEGNDQITGIGSGSIDAGTGNDTLSAHVLGATITLGTGQDRLTLLSWDNTSSVTVTDFAAGPGGDTLDINAILTNNLTSWDGSSNPFGSGHLRLAQDGDDTLLQVDQNGAAGGESYITLVRFQNTNAADFITNSFLPPYPLDGSTPVGQHIVGTPGDDPNLQGTIGDDLIDALAGNDTVDAGAGSDIVNAGDGNDTVVSGTGNDQIFGGAGFDQLAGGSGDDTLDAGADGAAMDGGTGADILTGSIVADQFTLVSDGSDDTATGGEGNDSFALLGNFTAGVFYQDQAGLNGGTDAVSGGDGNDTFDLSQSAERVLAFGGDGDDSFGSLAGTGELHGDGGSDSFNVHGGLSNFNNPLLVDGGADDDVIALNDRRGTLLTVLGGEGNDQITGIGSGSIDAGTGNDTLSAHVLGATITLGTGQDRLTLLSWDNTSSVTVTDFAAGPGGDTLDINAILTNNLTSWDGSSNPFGSGYLRLVQDGANTLIQVDVDGAGNGSAFTTLLILQNTTATDFTSDNFNPPFPPAGGQLQTGGPNIDNLTGGPGNDELYGFADNDTLSGLGGADKLFGGAGNDWLTGGAGNDIIDGQSDTDTANFSGNRADYAVSGGPADLTLADGAPNRDGTDIVRNVEFIQFADGLVTVADLFNAAPAITSNNGGDTAEISVAENTTAVTTVQAIDPDAGQMLAYAIVPAASGGGADAALFTIDPNTGALSFAAVPDFEAPADANGDNIYELAVQADDGNGGTDRQAISITVTGQNEPPVITSSPDLGTVQEDGTATLSGTLTATDQDAGTQFFWSLVGGSVSSGTDYDFAMDSLTVVRNGTVIFEDTFSDGSPPPSVPAGSASPAYSMVGSLTEAGDKLILTENGAVPLFAPGTPDPFVGQIATLQTDIDPANFTAGLKSTDNFRIEGRFDLVIPDSAREAYGIRLSDRLVNGSGTPPDQPGDDIIELVVVRTILGDVRVQLMERDPAADTTTILASQVISPPANADQIILRLGHLDSNPGVVTASFSYLSAGTVLSTHGVGTGQIFGTEPDGPDNNTSGDENWTRPEIISFAPQITASTLVGTYGTLGIDQSGQWDYTLANGQANVQALAAGETVTDEFLVRVGDGAGGIATQTVSVAVSGINDAPTDIALSANTVAENAAAGTVVGDLTALDVDNGASATFSLVDDAGGRFAIVGTQFVVANGALIDFEQAQSHQVTVLVDDGGLGGTFEEALTIDVTDVAENAVPIITSDGGGDTAAVSVAESTTLVTTLTASDPDAGQTLSFSISGGEDAGLFEIRNGNELHFKAAPDFEAPAPAHVFADNAYDVVVGTSDGNGGVDTQTLTVTVTDANDSPRILPAAFGPDLVTNGGFETGLFGWSAENGVEALGDFDAFGRQSQGTLFANFNGRGGPSGGVLVQTIPTEAGKTYVLSFDAGVYGFGNQTNALHVEALDGGATPLLSTTIDDTTPNAAGSGGSYTPYALTFTATGPSTTIRFTDGSTGDLLSVDLQVDNVQVHEQGHTISENNTFVTNVPATDPDAGQPLTYSIAGGVDAALFTIDADTGALSFAAAPNLEVPTDANGDNLYDVTVQVSDGSLTDNQAIAVSIANVNEAPYAANPLGVVTATLNQPFTFTIPAGTFVDPDAGDTVSFLYATGNSDGPLPGWLSFNAATGTLSGTLRPEDLGLERDIKVWVTDSNGAVAHTQSNYLTINVIAPPTITSDGGGDTAAVAVGENSDAVTIVSATGYNGQPLTYSIAGGADAALFTIDANTGALSFAAAPNFEVPTDANGDNLYDLVVQAADGAGSADAQVIAVTVTNVGGVSPPASNAATQTGTGEEDTLTGLGGANTLQGLGGNDILAGGGGADTLDGGTGTDDMTGGTGSDTYIVDNAGDTVTELAGQGTDTVRTSLGQYTLGANVENLAFIGIEPFQGTGNVLANTITGGTGGDVLNGGAGVDTLIGGAGNDTYIVDRPGDSIIETSTGGIDSVLAVGGSNFTLGGNVENLTYAGDYAGITRFTLNGNGLANILTGGNGVDTLDGGNGNDTLLGLGGGDRLFGGGGNDTIEGGAGNDLLDGGASSDTFVFKPGFGSDRITGFDANPSGGQDLIELSGIGITADNFAAHVVITDVGADTLVTIDGDASQTIRLEGVGNASTVNVDDFRFL